MKILRVVELVIRVKLYRCTGRFRAVMSIPPSIALTHGQADLHFGLGQHFETLLDILASF